MSKRLHILMAALLIPVLVLTSCAPKATEAPAPAATEAPAAPATEAPAAGPKDVAGMKVCYLLPTLGNPFLGGLAYFRQGEGCRGWRRSVCLWR